MMTHKDIAALMRGIAPVLQDQITEGLRPFADMLIEQRRTIAALEQRIAAMEGGPDAADKAAMRAIEGEFAHYGEA